MAPVVIVGVLIHALDGQRDAVRYDGLGTHEVMLEL